MSELDRKIAEAAAKKKEAETETPKKPGELNWAEAELRLRKVEDFQLTFQGKPGYNPYLWMRDKLNPYKHRFLAGVRTSELFVQIMSIPLGEEPSGENLNLRDLQLPPFKEIK